MDFVRRNLLVARSEQAVPGDEEILKLVEKKPSRDVESPWLWLALAVVVGALLAVVARLSFRKDG